MFWRHNSCVRLYTYSKGKTYRNFSFHFQKQLPKVLISYYHHYYWYFIHPTIFWWVSIRDRIHLNYFKLLLVFACIFLLLSFYERVSYSHFYHHIDEYFILTHFIISTTIITILIFRILLFPNSLLLSFIINALLDLASRLRTNIFCAAIRSVFGSLTKLTEHFYRFPKIFIFFPSTKTPLLPLQL